MRKFLSSIFKKIASKLDNIESQAAVLVAKEEFVLGEGQEIKQSPPQSKKVSKNKITKKKAEIIPYKRNPARDLMEIMEVPFLSL